MTVQPPSPPYVGPPKWHGSATNKPITRVVIHCTAGAEPGVEGAARATAAYTKGTSRPSSWHYCADSRESVQLTYDSVVAYHDGTNSHSIGYELSCSLANEGEGHWVREDHQDMLDIAAEDVARLCLAYDVPIVKLSVAEVRGGKKGICGHVDMRDAFPGSTSHWDPGPHFPWAPFIARVKAAADRLLKAPDPKPDKRTLKVVSFNVERARPARDAVRDVLTLWDKHRPGVMALQEAEGYFHEFRRLSTDNGTKLELFADGENPENALLVPEGRGEAFLASDYGDGWTREGGAARGPGIFPRVTIDGWIRVASVHWPPSTAWPGGNLQTPPARRDDVVAIAEDCKAFLERPNLTRVCAGDWNEPPSTQGKYTPRWVASETGSQIKAPKSRVGHGRIDFGIVKRGRMIEVRKDTDVREGSDHEPVVFTVVEA